MLTGRTVAGGIAVLVCCVAAVSIWRGNGTPFERGEDYVKRVAIESRDRFAPIPMILLTSAREDIRRVLDAASVEDAKGIAPDRISSLKEALADFLWHRFGQESPQSYRAWRSVQPVGWESMERLLRSWTIDEQVKTLTDQSWPEAPDHAQIFDLLWRAKRSFESGRNLPRSVASGRDGLAIVLGRMTPGNPVRKLVHGDLDSQTWHGGIARSHCCWFAPTWPTTAALKAGEAVDYAECGLVLEYPDGIRSPMILTYVWDRAAGVWVLHYLNVNNDIAHELAIDY